MSGDPFQTEAADAAQKAQIDREAREAKQAVEDIKWLMAHKAGKRIVWRLLDRTGVFRNPFNNSGSVMAFKAGEQNVGQALLAEIMTHCPDAFMSMLTDANREKSGE